MFTANTGHGHVPINGATSLRYIHRMLKTYLWMKLEMQTRFSGYLNLCMCIWPHIKIIHVHYVCEGQCSGNYIKWSINRKCHTVSNYSYTRSPSTKMHWNGSHRFVIDVYDPQRLEDFFFFYRLGAMLPGLQDQSMPIISFLLFQVPCRKSGLSKKNAITVKYSAPNIFDQQDHLTWD